MQKRTSGTVVSVKKQWWLKVNTKVIRTAGPLDGATFPHVVKVRYTVDGQEYEKRKWIGAGKPVPGEGDTVQLVYDDENPEDVSIVF